MVGFAFSSAVSHRLESRRRKTNFQRYMDGSRRWHSQLVDRPGSWDIAEPEPTVINETAARFEELVRGFDAPGELQALFTHSILHRRYENTEAAYEDFIMGWANFYVEHQSENGCRVLRDGSVEREHLPALFDVAVALLADWDSEYRAEMAGTLPPRSNLLLEPSVSAVLFHELVGHASEEFAGSNVGVRVGPDDLSVTAIFPRSATLDDEGVPAIPKKIVAGGILVDDVFDRESAARSHERAPAGLAQAGPHAGPPRARCTHLICRSESESCHRVTAESLDRAVVCHATDGAEYVDGAGVINIEAATEWVGGTVSRAMPPFSFRMTVYDLHHHLVEIGADLGRGRAGDCLKGDQKLPTVNWAPTVLLDGVPLSPPLAR